MRTEIRSKQSFSEGHYQQRRNQGTKFKKYPLRCCVAWLLISFPKLRLQRNLRRDDETGDRRQNYPDKKMPVAQVFLQPAAPHARQHHAQRHEARADRVMRRLMFAARDADHIQHERRETETIAEL